MNFIGGQLPIDVTGVGFVIRGVGLAGLTLLKEHPQLTDVVAESYNRINSMFNELGN